MRLAFVIALGLLTACGEEPPRCEAVQVQAELVLEVGATSELVYETEASLPSSYKKLLVRCPTAAADALSVFHDGFGCSTDPGSDGSRSTGWLIGPAMEYVLNVKAGIAGDYELVAEVRDDTEEGRLEDPICTVATHVRVIDGPDAAVAED